jgi:hypothetical protein
MFGFFNNKNLNSWKQKAIERRLNIKNLKKEIKRIKKSRNKWKEDALKYKHQNNELTNIIKKNS